MIPLAPGRLSITTVWPSASDRPRRDEPGQRVRRTAWRYGDNHANGLGRKTRLRCNSARAAGQSENAEGISEHRVNQ